MTMHKDLVHFQLNPSGMYQDDGKIPFHFNTSDGLNKDLLVDAAIATGAFPGGLAPRVVIRDPKFVNDNHLLKITHGKKYLVDPLADYNAVCVDGGVINNEPYDLTETIMTDRRKAEIRRSANKEEAKHFKLSKSASDFDSTILMIDPFPSYDDKPNANYFDLQALKFTLPQLFGAMRQQLMVKTDLLERAYSDTDYTRFMVAPIRTKKGKTQKYSIACGSLGGFGGFFSKQFRIHDYLLGRRNCQRFIQQYFCVPVSANHPIIKFGYEDLSSDAITMIQVNNGVSLPIIPDIRIAEDQKTLRLPPEEEEFPFPSISLKYLLNLQKKIQTRFGIVLDNIKTGINPEDDEHLVNQIVKNIRKKSWFSKIIITPIVKLVTKVFLWMGKCVGKKIAAEKFIDAVVTDMDEKGLLQKD